MARPLGIGDEGALGSSGVVVMLMHARLAAVVFFRRDSGVRTSAVYILDRGVMMRMVVLCVGFGQNIV